MENKQEKLSLQELQELVDQGAAMLTDDFLADGVPESIPVEREEL